MPERRPVNTIWVRHRVLAIQLCGQNSSGPFVKIVLQKVGDRFHLYTNYIGKGRMSVNVRKELEDILKDLPADFQKIARKLFALQAAEIMPLRLTQIAPGYRQIFCPREVSRRELVG